MKHPLVTGLLCTAVICLGSLPVLAQENNGTASSPNAEPGQPGGFRGGPPGGTMNREEGARLAAAREKAKEDPTVRSLMEAREALDKQLEAAMNAAMLAADPSVAPSLEKVKESKGRAKGMRDRFESLTPEQKTSLREARDAAKSDPAVVAARQKMDEAKTPEERREAGKALHEAMKKAITQKDPSLAPLLDQLGPPRGPGGRGGPRGPGGPDGPPPPPPGE